MRAFSRKTQIQKDHDRIDKYIRDNYEEVVYDAIGMNAPNIVRQTVAEFLLAMSFHGYGAKRLQDMYEWFLTVTNMPGKTLGKEVNAHDVIDTMTKKYGIDFERIQPKYQSYEEFKRGKP